MQRYTQLNMLKRDTEIHSTNYLVHTNGVLHYELPNVILLRSEKNI